MPPSPPDNGPVLLDIAAIEAGWKSEPRTRGTFSILSLCLSTIFICVWKAWHPNVPRHSPDQRSKIEGLVKSVPRFLFFLFFPEALFVTALNELRQACILYYDVHQLDPTWYFELFIKFFVRSSELQSKVRVVYLGYPKILIRSDLEFSATHLPLDSDSFVLRCNGWLCRKDRK